MTSPGGAPDGGYGWVVLAASFGAHSLIYGVGWTVGVFYQIFIEHFDESSAGIALITSLLTATLYGSGAIGGVFNNRFGYRAVTIAGGIAGSLGLILSAFATEVFHLYITFGVLAGVGYGIAYIPTVTVIAEYFHKKRPLAMGISVSGVGVGTFVFPPVIRALEQAYGWRGALLLMGGIGFNVCVCGALFRPCRKRITRDTQETRKDYRHLFNLSILKRKSYLILCLNQVLFALGQSVVYVHIAYYASTIGSSDNESALLVSLVGILNLIGRVLIGVIAHHPRVCPVVLFIVCFVTTGVIIATLGLIKNVIVLMIGAALFGLFSASWGTLNPEVIIQVLSADPKLLANAYGYILIFDAIGSLLGPPTAGWLYDSTHDYKMSFFLSGSSCALAGLVMLVPWKFIRNKRKHSTVEATIGQDLVETAAISSEERQGSQKYSSSL